MADSDLTAPLVERAATARGGGKGPELTPGTTLGRYVVVEKLGAGTGGTVYAVFDSHLGRKVALKVLRGGDIDGDGKPSAALLREAQLVATLDHPNIVTVHDLGQHEGHAFIAMELVAGSDLAAWLRRNPPSGTGWRDRLAPWLLAGRGLVAAHARGVIHGDFKPANVLLGSDGRVRVTDFGVARLREHETEDADTPASPEPRLWGTPLYMAPELFDGRAPDERSDAYAYCASVYEALYGAPPADGDDLVRAKQAVPNPTDPRGVPTRVLDVLRRGLRADPRERFASVAAVVDALERSTRARRGPWLAAGGVVVLASIGALAWFAIDDAPRCTGADAQLHGTWDEPRRAEARAAFDASQLPYAETAWRRFAATLDRYAATWVATYTEVCELGEDSDPLLDEKFACLTRRRAGLLALVDGIVHGESSRVANAAEAAEQLEPAADCLVLADAADATAPPSELAQEVERIDALIASAQIAIDLGDGDEATRVADEALARAEAIGFAPLVARAQWASGRAKANQGDYAEARALLEQAALAAEELGDDDTSARAGLSLVYTFDVGFDDAKAALRWIPHVEVALQRGRADPRLWAMFHDYRALALEDLGRTEEAAAAIALAVDEWREIDSDFATAEIAEREGKLAQLRGDIHGAAAKQREAVRGFEEAAGWPHPTVVIALDGLASYLEAAGDSEGSIEAFERAVTGARAAFGVDHPLTLSLASNLASVLSVNGRHEEALDHYADAQQGFARTMGTDHPRYIGVIANMAATLGRAGRHAEARKWAEESIGPLEEHYGPDHRVLGYAYATLGSARRRSGDPAAAIEALEKSIAIYLAQGLPPVEAADVQFELAQALVEAGRDRTRAHELARAAQKSWNEEGSFDNVALVAAWLNEN